MTLSGWGRTFPQPAQVARPETVCALRTAAAQEDRRGVLARGAGRSYGDAAVNGDGRVVLTERLNRFLDFDPVTGQLVAEAGVTFRDLLDSFLPRGWMAPVTPGTSFVTLGGALAADVHGKNHDEAGSFGGHIEWFDLLGADGRTTRVGPQSHPDLFAATIGGMGLTGIVERLCLRLKRVPSAAIAMGEERAVDLDAMMARLADLRSAFPFSVAWIDCLARGGAMGRGVVEWGRFAESGAPPAAGCRPPLSVPLDLPSFVMARPFITCFNEIYWRRIPAGGRERIVPAPDFLYPLDAIHQWNRLYGRRGFHQFQCVLPDETARDGLHRLLQAVSDAGTASFLAVLKTLGGEGPGYLSFPMRGWTLALDLPAREGVATLLGRLEMLTLDYGGRVYLAKDSMLSAASLARMYPHLPQFASVCAAIDPRQHWQSSLARRLGLRSGP